MKLRIGIHTCGFPRLSRRGDNIIVENAMMGIGFHWQRSYPLILKGEPEFLSSPENGISLICNIEIEDYLRSVVSSEMNPDAPFEFIKAHAIIARSWAVNAYLKSRLPHQKDSESSISGETIIRIYDRSDHTLFHLCNDDHCQRFQGESAVTAKAEKAVTDTAGLVLTDRSGKIADARYSKCCGGKTEIFSICWQNRDLDYLQSIDDPWCDLSALPDMHRQKILKSVLKNYDRETTPDFYRWKRSVLPEIIKNRLHLDFNIDIGVPVLLTPVKRGPSGRISLLRITGTEGEITIGKELAIRRLLSDDCLLSSAFDIDNGKDRFILEGKGWGHGVGLCQIGAAAMAFHGYSAADILNHYYPHTSLTHIND